MILAAHGDRSKLEMTGNLFEGTRVASGDSIWEYVGQLEQYRVHAAKEDSSGPGGIINANVAGIFNALQAEVRDIDQNALSAVDAPGETLTVSGRAVPCRVILVNYIPGPDSLKVMSAPRKLWVDPVSGLMLKTEVHRTLIALPAGQDLSWTEATVWDRVSLDPAQPDSAFRFHAPESARRVSAFEPPQPKRPSLAASPARDFTLDDLKGASHKLSAQKGKVVLLDFWATWCGPCRLELPSVAHLAGELGPKGLVVWGVNVNEPKERVQQFLQTNHYTFPVLLDVGGGVAGMYGASSIPTLVVVDKKGTVSDYFVGVQQEETIRAALKKAGVE
jgi:thiol-disulfide isomerase/thioredoxin